MACNINFTVVDLFSLRIKQQEERRKKKASPGKSPKKAAGDNVDPYDVDTDEDEKPGTSL